MFPKIQAYIEALNTELIPANRKLHLDETASLLRSKIVENQRLNLNFVCTHNSRRSQFSQIWGSVMASHFEVPVNCFSSGVEVTAINERVVHCLKGIGFTIEHVDRTSSSNPVYSLGFSKEAPAIICFSKTFEDASIERPYIALMTCADADENCPYLPEALARIPLRYEDPKAFDDTPLEEKMYAERAQQIACELYYMFKQL